jgi:LPS sulfotransferase NodH
MTIQETGLQRYVVLSSARSGSNMLKSLLDAHPQVECLGEIFNPVYGPGYKKWVQKSRVRHILNKYARNYCVESYLDSLFTKNPQRNSPRALGFKVMYPGQFNRCSLFPYYWQEHEFKIVRLTRRNLLRRYLSGRIACLENVWSAPEHRGKQVTIKLDIDDLIRSIHRMETINMSIDALANEFQNVMVDYEQLVADRTPAMRRIFEFIGVSATEAEHIKSGTARQNPDKLIDLIQNYDEVYEALENTPYEWFLVEG